MNRHEADVLNLSFSFVHGGARQVGYPPTENGLRSKMGIVIHS
jgi:hypothetical protein